MDDSILGLFACIGVAMLICILVGGLLFGPVYLISSKSCSAKAERLGLEYDFGAFQGCFVRDGDHWVDYNRYRVILHDK